MNEHRAPDGAPEGIRGGLEYSTDLFDRDTAEALVGRFVRLLEAAVAAPEQPIGLLDILTPEERHRILVEWNGTARDIAPVTVPRLFEAQAARTPDAVAVVFEDQHLTYGNSTPAPTSWPIICRLLALVLMWSWAFASSARSI